MNGHRPQRGYRIRLTDCLASKFWRVSLLRTGAVVVYHGVQPPVRSRLMTIGGAIQAFSYAKLGTADMASIDTTLGVSQWSPAAGKLAVSSAAAVAAWFVALPLFWKVIAATMAFLGMWKMLELLSKLWRRLRHDGEIKYGGTQSVEFYPSRDLLEQIRSFRGSIRQGAEHRCHICHGQEDYCS